MKAATFATALQRVERLYGGPYLRAICTTTARRLDDVRQRARMKAVGMAANNSHGFSLREIYQLRRGPTGRPRKAARGAAILDLQT